MNVLIDLDVIENIKKFHDRRPKSQKSVFALILGKIIGYDKYHVTDCIYRFFIHKEQSDEEQNKGQHKFTQYFEGEIVPALDNYKQNHPDHYLLGGITTETDLSSDLSTFWHSIFQIKHSINKKTDLVLTLDFNVLNDISQSNIYNVKAYFAKMDKLTESVIFSAIPISNVSSTQYQRIRSNAVKSIIQSSNPRFNSLLEKLNEGEAMNGGVEEQTKREINTLDFLLKTILDFLESEVAVPQETYKELENVVQQIEEYFSDENSLRQLSSELKRESTIKVLGEILSEQLNITDTITKKFI